MIIPATELEFPHWQIDEIPDIKKGIERIVITQCGTDEAAANEDLPLTIRCRFRLEKDGINIFSCLAEKTFNVYSFKITIELIIKLIILTNLEFDIDFNLKKIGTRVEFAQIPLRDNKEFLQDAKDLTLKLISIQSKM